MRVAALVAASSLMIAAAHALPAAHGAAQRQCGAPKNLILLIADGVGFNGWLASEYWMNGAAGQLAYQTAGAGRARPLILGVATQALHNESQPQDYGYEPKRRWASGDLFPGRGFETTDSAAASTAIHSGVKTLRRRIGIDATGAPLPTLHRLAIAQGKAAGVVTSVQAANATPAAAWARAEDRDEFIPIFTQMIDGGLSVVIGAGHPYFDDDGRAVAAPAPAAFAAVGGEATWRAITAAAGHLGYALVDTNAGFAALAAGRNLPSRLIGVAPVRQTLQQKRAAGVDRTPAPDLSTLTLGALNVLAQDPDGFVVTIEGGAPDWANHANQLDRFLEEQRDFHRAVATAMAWVEAHSCWGETLMIVTSDHESGGLWPARAWRDANGDGRFNVVDGDRLIAHAAPAPTPQGQTPDVVYATIQHTGDLVPLWAIGAGAHLLAEGARRDTRAAALWGSVYGWDGSFIDITAIFPAAAQAIGLDPRRCDLTAPGPPADPICGRAWIDQNLRLNDLQAIGTHNSYKQAIHPNLMQRLSALDPARAATLDYAHEPLAAQLQAGVRQLEIDVLRDPEGGRFAAPLGLSLDPVGFDAAAMARSDLKVLHIQDVDFRSSCPTLVECLSQVRDWSDRDRDHLPILIMMNLKRGPSPWPGGIAAPEWDEAALDALDTEIRTVFANAQLIRPDDVQGAHSTLRDAVLADGWPRLGQARGRIMFALDENAQIADLYRGARRNLEGRVAFVNAPENSPIGAYMTVNDPVAQGDRIRELVRQGFVVRTRADANTHEARMGDPRRRDAGFASGAQFVSTDYLRPRAEWSAYSVAFADGRLARCNPVRQIISCPALE